MAKAVASAPPGNHLLARLPAPEYRRLESKLKPFPLKPGDVLYEVHAPLDYMYFPIEGTLSAVTVMEDGSAIEVATVGNEGAVGIGAIVGAEASLNRIFVQLPGEALRIKIGVLNAEIERDGPLRRLLLIYLSAFFNQVSQSVACNGLHPVLKRCCRWLLLTHDRSSGDELKLTHEFLAAMLGVRRPGVTEVLKSLEERGLICHQRGVITVLDRKGLENASCECYRTVRDEFDRLQDFPAKSRIAM